MKLISKILLVAALASGAAYSYANTNPAVKIMASEIVDRHLSGFNAVDVGGSFDVQLVQGSTESVKVEAPSDVIDRIITQVDGGVLKIYNKHDTFNWGNWWGNHKKIVVYVTVKTVNAISVTGSGDVAFKQGLTVPALKLHVSGSGDVSGVLNAKKLESSISGSGDVHLSGHSDISIVDVSGSGDFNAHNLVTVSTSIRLSGSGDAEINANDKIDAVTHGSGDIRYTGSAHNISSAKTGSGDIERM